MSLTIGDDDDAKAQQLITLIKKYGEMGYVDRIEMIIKNAVLDVSSDHSTFDFFTARAQIGEEINALLEQEL